MSLLREDLIVVFTAAHRRLRPRTAVPEIEVEFFPFAGLNHTVRLRENRLTVRLSDVFIEAPREVYESLALILLAKLYRKKVDAAYHRAYRTFILTDEIQNRARVARIHRRRPARPASSRGRHVDLDLLFDQLNGQYFAGAIDKPRLSWTAKKSRCVLGRYDATLHAIYISRVFDTADLPRYVVEYVLFHEMLHVKHRSRVHDSRLVVHTPEFKSEERNFLRYQEAQVWLKRF
ncbi:MAG: M48 family metallopeptidase [Acidobacteria bacterium]|nr:M48 family metallopeptidase [Acidobacteriota bacterium]